jgi:histidyl-tRNA synthetase
VYLFSTPTVHLRDFFVRCDLDTEYKDAILKIDSELQNSSIESAKKHTIEVYLYDPAMKAVSKEPIMKKDADFIFHDNRSVVKMQSLVKEPLKWSAEKPNLYTVVLVVKDSEGQTIEVESTKFGFREIETPAIETTSLLCEKEGNEIKQQIFTLEKKGKEEFGLRFDMTVPSARMFIAKQKELAKPVKWFYITRMWRYEQPQKGRLREFYQFGIECFGSDKADADAEVIRVAIDALLAFGLKKGDFFVRVNNRNLLQGLIEKLGVGNINEVITIIDKVSKLSENEFIAELEKAKLTQKQITEIDKIIKTKDLKSLKNLNEAAQQGLKQLQEVIGLLEDRKDFIRIDLSTARGLAYYTGTVFEIFDKDMKYRAICGGGRYDNMISQFGGEKTPATGFGMGFATLQLLLEEKMLLPSSDLGVDYYIAPVNPAVKEKAIEIATKLRGTYSVEVDLMERNLKNQFDYANRINAKKIVIVGEKDLKEGKVTVREMGSGKEEKVNLSDL